MPPPRPRPRCAGTRPGGGKVTGGGSGPARPGPLRGRLRLTAPPWPASGRPPRPRRGRGPARPAPAFAGAQREARCRHGCGLGGPALPLPLPLPFCQLRPPRPGPRLRRAVSGARSGSGPVLSAAAPVGAGCVGTRRAESLTGNRLGLPEGPGKDEGSPPERELSL